MSDLDDSIITSTENPPTYRPGDDDDAVDGDTAVDVETVPSTQNPPTAPGPELVPDDEAADATPVDAGLTAEDAAPLVEKEVG